MQRPSYCSTTASTSITAEITRSPTHKKRAGLKTSGQSVHFGILTTRCRRVSHTFQYYLFCETTIIVVFASFHVPSSSTWASLVQNSPLSLKPCFLLVLLLCHFYTHLWPPFLWFHLFSSASCFHFSAHYICIRFILPFTHSPLAYQVLFSFFYVSDVWFMVLALWLIHEFFTRIKYTFLGGK